MPKWIHDRAEHLLVKNPGMSKSKAFAIATMQAHSLGKSPKGYGTPEGRQAAKEKYDTPKDDKKTANPGKLNSPKLAEGISGGKGDNVPVKDLPSKEMAMGGKVEKEHTPSKSLAKDIAKDHLTEIPDYYTRLKKMEDAAKKEAGWLQGAMTAGKNLLGGAAKAAPTVGAGKAQGVLTQMSRGRNFGGAAVDPFVKMRQPAQPGAAKMAERVDAALRKMGFEVSKYSGPLSVGRIPLASGQPGPGQASRGHQTLLTALAKTAGFGSGTSVAASPMKRLAATRSASKLDYTHPGQSIAQMSKPKGFGVPIPGAKTASELIEEFADAYAQIHEAPPAPHVEFPDTLAQKLANILR